MGDDRLDMQMFAGNSKSIEITVVDENAAAVNLTGVVINYILCRKASTPPIVTKRNNGGGIDILDNILTIRLEPTDTESCVGWYYHEAKLTTAAGITATIFSGLVQVIDTGAQ